MNAEQERLTESKWKKWGPYVSDRQWGTVREDYSADGEPWKSSGQYLTLNEIADEISKRLTKLFLRDANGQRPVFGENEKLQNDPHFNKYILFYEYFHADTGTGLGASHQTGWTGLIAKLLQPRREPHEEMKNRDDLSAIENQEPVK